MVQFTTRTGLTLRGTARGPADGPPVLLLHGGGQTHHSWSRSAIGLAERGYCAISIDLRGHGDSAWDDEGRYHPADIAQDISDIATALGPEVALVGASLGGLASMLAIGENPEPIASSLVLVDVVPKLERSGTSEIRSFMTANPNGFASLSQAADAIAAYLPHRKRERGSAGLEKNLRKRNDGRYYWHWDPRIVDAQPLDTLNELEARLERSARNISVPTLIIRGGRSRIVSDDGIASLLSVLPHAEVVNVANADHMVAGDDNDAFNAALLDFFALHGAGNAPHSGEQDTLAASTSLQR